MRLPFMTLSLQLVHGPGAAMKTVNEIVGDGARGLVAILGIAGPGIEIDDLGLAILADDGVAAEDLNPKDRCCIACHVAQPIDFEGIAHLALVTVIEPLEPAAIGRAA